MQILKLIFSISAIFSMALMTALTTATPAVAQSHSAQAVNGKNVKVAYFDGGRFEQTSSRIWKEYGTSGGPRFTFRETHRDDWSVYLRDDSRNADLQIDVHRKMILIGWNGGTRSDLYPVTRFQAKFSTSQSAPTSTSRPSSGGKVTLYQHCNYKGYSVSLPAGAFSLSRLQSMGMRNDDVSSLKVTPGYKVEIYKDAGYRGARRTLEGNVSCLTSYGMNDALSSVKVMSRSAPTTPRPSTPTQRPQLTANKEQTCYNLIQGKIAWNQSGNKTWSPGNVRALCAGTNNPAATRDCFRRGINQGKGWSQATQNCKVNTNSFRQSYAPTPGSTSPSPNPVPQTVNKAGNLACICTGNSCGNAAIGGNQGDVYSHISSAYAKSSFTSNSSTGWTCALPSKTSGSGGPLACYCSGYCGNGGIGANPKTLRLGVSQSSLDKYYGGGKKGNKTGWICGKYRGKS